MAAKAISATHAVAGWEKGLGAASALGGEDAGRREELARVSREVRGGLTRDGSARSWSRTTWRQYIAAPFARWLTEDTEDHNLWSVGQVGSRHRSPVYAKEPVAPPRHRDGAIPPDHLA